MAALPLLPDIYLVGGGQYGLSHGTDCNVYLVDGGAQAALIDAGSGLGFSQIVENVRSTGCDPRNVALIINTHADWDHAGGDHLWQKTYSTRVVASRLASRQLEVSLWQHPLLAGIEMAPVNVDAMPEGGRTIQVGRHSLEVVPAPGHTADHVVVRAEISDCRSAFTGDLVDGTGRLGAINLKKPALQYEQSLRDLSQWGPDAIFPGHNTFNLTQAHVAIDAAIHTLQAPWFAVDTAPPPFFPSWWLLRNARDTR